MKSRQVIAVNAVIVALEVIAFIHDIYSFGIETFKWYTVDSNVLQLFVSAIVLYYCVRGRKLPDFVTALHFISAVGLTVTFIIAAFVLAPQEGFAYYFLENVAPINHFIGPLLSVISLLFLEHTEKLPLRIVVYPAAVTLAYGVICLILNAVDLLDGPYFFLKVHEQSVSTIVIWFVIIAVLCIALALVYYKIKYRRSLPGTKRSSVSE